MKVLYIVTARGGSKGLPRKNIKLLGGIPLVAWKIIAAQKTTHENRLIVSTDDVEIASVAKRYGAEVPFIRPDYLASDDASSIDVVLHAMNWIISNDKTKYDYICLLEPSSPFASYLDLDAAINNIIEKNCDTLLGMTEVHVSSIFIDTLDENGGLSSFYNKIIKMKSLRRQDQRKEYTMNGCMYISKWDYFLHNKTFHSIKSIPYIMDAEHSIEIDTLFDYKIAEKMIEDGVIDLELWKNNTKNDYV